VLYLADTSIWVGSRRRDAKGLAELLAQRLEADEIAICTPIALEVLTGPETGEELDLDWNTTWRHLLWLPVTDEVMERSLDLLLTLAHASSPGAHRRSPLDYIVAACAEAAGNDVVVWHTSPDVALICDHARIRHEVGATAAAA
jgi:predicted nucleic acid-binding protein